MKDDANEYHTRISETVLGYNFISFYYGVEEYQSNRSGSVKSTPILLVISPVVLVMNINVTGQYLENHTSSSEVYIPQLTLIVHID